MNVNLKRCPNSETHRVYGGFPEYVCPTCATEWVVVNSIRGTYVVYTHFNSDGEILRSWRVQLEERLQTRRRSVAI